MIKDLPAWAATEKVLEGPRGLGAASCPQAWGSRSWQSIWQWEKNDYDQENKGTVPSYGIPS